MCDVYCVVVQEFTTISSAVSSKKAGFEEEPEDSGPPLPARPPKRPPKQPMPEPEPEPEYEAEPEPEPVYEAEPEPEPVYEAEPEPQQEWEPEPGVWGCGWGGGGGRHMYGYVLRIILSLNPVRVL